MSDNQHELNQTNSSDCITCSHRRIHHPGGNHCATTTVTGPATENHNERTETRCDCEQFTEETK